MRVVFLGSGAFGLPTLGALASRHEVCAVVSQPDRPAGRRKKPSPTPVSAWAAEHLPDAPLIRPENANDLGVIEELRSLDADAWVVIAFGQKLSRDLLTRSDGSDQFACNLHASLLPRWRGAAPIHRAILAGDEVTGNSVITIAQRMDAGAVLATTERRIDPDMTAGELHDALADDGPAAVLRVLDELAAGTLRGEEQDESAVTLAKKLSRADAWVDFAEPAADVRRRVHGLTPWPGVSVGFRGEPVKLLRVRVAEAIGAGSEEGGGAPVSPGEIVDPAAGRVACGGGSVVEVADVQPAGKKPMAWPAFANGRGVERGEKLEGGAAVC
mgnify:FL=1